MTTKLSLLFAAIAVFTFVGCDRAEQVSPSVKEMTSISNLLNDGDYTTSDAVCGATIGYVSVDIPSDIYTSDRVNVDCGVIEFLYTHNNTQYTGSAYAEMDDNGNLAYLGYDDQTAERLQITSSFLEGDNGDLFIETGRSIRDCYDICDEKKKGDGRGGCRLACWGDAVVHLICHCMI